jgi:hypothetical protein
MSGFEAIRQDGITAHKRITSDFRVYKAFNSARVSRTWGKQKAARLNRSFRAGAPMKYIIPSESGSTSHI